MAGYADSADQHAQYDHFLDDETSEERRTVPAYYYSAETERLRRSLQLTSGPSIGLPPSSFVVETDAGDEIHIPTRLLSNYATVVVGSPKCTKFGHSIIVNVVNRTSRNNGAERPGTEGDDALSALTGQTAASAAKQLAKPLIDKAGKAVEKKITKQLGTQVGGRAATGVSGFTARRAGGFAARQLTGLAVKTAASQSVAAMTGGPASLLSLAVSATSTGPGADRYHAAISGRSSTGIPVTIFISGEKP